MTWEPIEGIIRECQVAIANNVTLKNDLFLDKVINIMGLSGLKEQDWTIDHEHH